MEIGDTIKFKFGRKKNTFFKITEEPLEKLKGDKIPENVITKLSDLKDRHYTSELKFEKAIKKAVLSDGDVEEQVFDQHKSTILKYSKTEDVEGVVVKLFPKTVYLRVDFPNHKGKIVKRKRHQLE